MKIIVVTLRENSRNSIRIVISQRLLQRPQFPQLPCQFSKWKSAIVAALRYNDYSVARFFLYSSNPLSRQLPRFAISLSLSPRFKIPRCLINDYCLSFAFQTAPPPLQNPDEYFNATLPLFPSKLHFHSHRGYNPVAMMKFSKIWG